MPSAAPEKALLVGVGLKREASLTASSLEELERLAETAGARVVGVFSQLLARFHPASLIGEGKMEEIAAAVKSLSAGTVIFDMELSASQQRTLEKFCKAKIIDRTRLILDIFAQRARTSEGRLQVELAQLSYMLPRLTGAWRGFSQQVGGIGTRGPGERKLEYERRHIQYRIIHLQHELERVRRDRELRRERRLSVPVPQVALIGYTNVGKSTLLNALTRGAPVYADDKLFATLDPTSRRVRLPEGFWAVMTDTVGFIQRLPTNLVAAFRATLEEARWADCLLLISDASSPDRKSQEEAVQGILKDLGAQGVPQVKVLNKADRLPASERRGLQHEEPGALLVSAATGEGLPEALKKIQGLLSRRWLLRELDMPYSAKAAVAEVYRSCQVLSVKHLKDRARYRLRMTQENWERLQAKTKAQR
ncbi:MAG: GTPase HflX [Elusimicrobia bacterium]|nr:GTPase HflX [Elusimicrobiota bacterium]